MQKKQCINYKMQMFNSRFLLYNNIKMQKPTTINFGVMRRISKIILENETKNVLETSTL